MKLQKFLPALVASAPFFIAGTALAQWQVPLGDVPIGRGSGTGFTSKAGAGVDFNTLNAQTAPYTGSTTDCSKTLTLGGNTFFALTVGAASGFPATCSMVVANIDTGRGKLMTINGVTFPNSGILWPGQTFTLKNENNVWTIINQPGRWKLATNVQFEVNSAGNNANDGLATGAGGAFQTINGAIGVMSQILDPNNQGVVLHTNCPATYTESVRFLPIVGQLIGNAPASNLNPTLSGDTTTPTNCILTSSSGATVQAIGNTNWNIQGFQLKNTDGSSPCILVDQQSWIRAGKMDFGSCNGASGNQIVTENLSGYEAQANYTISAGASSHAFITNQGTFQQAGGITVTLSGTPAFPGGFTVSSRNSLAIWAGATFSGSATGPRYIANLGGGIETTGGGATFLPGNSAGTATNPGWYN